ncbi:hypothetical protein JCM3766R1_006094 [Sporobolomyces carnicolor]
MASHQLRHRRPETKKETGHSPLVAAEKKADAALTDEIEDFKRHNAKLDIIVDAIIHTKPGVAHTNAVLDWTPRMKGLFAASSKTDKAYRWIHGFFYGIAERVSNGERLVVRGTINKDFADVVVDRKTLHDFWLLEINEAVNTLAGAVKILAIDTSETTGANYSGLEHYMSEVRQVLMPDDFKHGEVGRERWLKIAREIKVLGFLVSACREEEKAVVDHDGNPIPEFKLAAIKERMNSWTPPKSLLKVTNPEKSLRKFRPVSRSAVMRRF